MSSSPATPPGSAPGTPERGPTPDATPGGAPAAKGQGSKISDALGFGGSGDGGPHVPTPGAIPPREVKRAFGERLEGAEPLVDPAAAQKAAPPWVPASPTAAAATAMVSVPAGEFLFGEERRTERLTAFEIDRDPVTNGEYEVFVLATGHRPPLYWKGPRCPDDLREHPVVGVDYFDAMAYARWAGKDLPYEDEWERAARGTDGRLYPWGDEPDLAANTARTGLKMTVPVGFFPKNVSPVGCRDLVGNAWELTHTPAPGGGVVVRGGSWFDFALYAKTTFRLASRPDSRNGTIGFRCVKRFAPRVAMPRAVPETDLDAPIAARRGKGEVVDASRFTPERRDLVPDVRRLRQAATARDEDAAAERAPAPFAPNRPTIKRAFAGRVEPASAPTAPTPAPAPIAAPSPGPVGFVPIPVARPPAPAPSPPMSTPTPMPWTPPASPQPHPAFPPPVATPATPATPAPPTTRALPPAAAAAASVPFGAMPGTGTPTPPAPPPTPAPGTPSAARRTSTDLDFPVAVPRTSYVPRRRTPDAPPPAPTSPPRPPWVSMPPPAPAPSLGAPPAAKPPPPAPMSPAAPPPARPTGLPVLPLPPPPLRIVRISPPFPEESAKPVAAAPASGAPSSPQPTAAAPWSAATPPPPLPVHSPPLPKGVPPAAAPGRAGPLPTAPFNPLAPAGPSVPPAPPRAAPAPVIASPTSPVPSASRAPDPLRPPYAGTTVPPGARGATRPASPYPAVPPAPATTPPPADHPAPLRLALLVMAFLVAAVGVVILLTKLAGSGRGSPSGDEAARLHLPPLVASDRDHEVVSATLLTEDGGTFADLGTGGVLLVFAKPSGAAGIDTAQLAVDLHRRLRGRAGLRVGLVVPAEGVSGATGPNSMGEALRRLGVTGDLLVVVDPAGDDGIAGRWRRSRWKVDEDNAAVLLEDGIEVLRVTPASYTAPLTRAQVAWLGRRADRDYAERAPEEVPPAPAAPMDGG